MFLKYRLESRLVVFAYNSHRKHRIKYLYEYQSITTAKIFSCVHISIAFLLTYELHYYTLVVDII